MMRSPEQQFSMAKRLPIGELAKVLQGQSDVVDMSIAEMVLRQKMQTQKAQQGMAAQPLANAPKVVERDLAQAQQMSQPQVQPMMDQGVAGLPADVDVPEFAGGGIVSFDVGGSVGAPLQSTRVPGPGVSFSQAFPNAATARSVAGRMPGLFGRIGAALSPMLAFEAFTNPTDDEIFRLREFDKAKAILKEAGFNDKDISALKTPDVYRMAAGYGYKPPVPATPATPVAPAAGPNATAPIEVVPPPAAAPAAADTSGIASLTGQISELRKRLSKPTMAGTSQEVEDMYKAAGISMEPFAARRKTLEEESAKTAEERREAGWTRALEAGLGILGGESPYALTNIGKGAQAAAKGAAEDLKEFRKLERERGRALSDIAVAENEFKRGITDKKISRYDDALQRYNSADMKLSELELGINLERAKLAVTRGAKREEVALKEANDQIQKEMAVNPRLAQNPNEYNARLTQLYNSYLSALSGKGVGQPTATVPSGVKVTREK